MALFDIRCETRTEGVLLLKPRGMLDVFAFGTLKLYLKNLSLQSGASKVVVDLEAVEFIASSGWSILIAGRHAFRRQGGDLTIRGMHENLRRVYETMKIESMLPLAGDSDEALPSAA